MQCSICNSKGFRFPQERSALEIHVCLTCGHEVVVRCNYPISPAFQSKHEFFTGTYKVSSLSNVTKNYLKIKKLLKDCERFQPSKLERQFLDQKFFWELGLFLDFEVERVRSECEKLSIKIAFTKIVEFSDV